MSNHKENDIKQRRNEHLLKNLPTEVLLKARSTLFSLGGALKPRHDQQRSKESKEAKSKKNQDRLKNSRSEPEFGDIRKKHKSRIEDTPREYVALRPRPLSVGAAKRYEDDVDFKSKSYSKDMSPLHRKFDSNDEVCVQSRLVVPVIDKLGLDVQMHDVNERPRKKLSFREPEIVNNGSATLGRSNKLMGVNSLSRRPNRISLRSSLECLDSDLESQAMRIVRTVGQAFEVCHKMNINSPDHPVPSTSSAAGEPVASCSGAPSKAPASDCGASESGGASTSKAAEQPQPARPTHLDLLPPPPRKENSKRAQPTVVPTINLPAIPDLPDLSIDLPECVTKVDLSLPDDDTGSALSTQHQVKLLREKLEQQAQQTRAAVAQLLLVRNQLVVEQTARCEAQARTHQLLVHNRELIDHIAALIGRLHDDKDESARPANAQQHTMLPQTDAAGSKKEKDIDNSQSCNGNAQTAISDDLISFCTGESHNNTASQSVENDSNVRASTTMNNIPSISTHSSNPTLNFAGMSNDEIQEYLIAKFNDMGVNGPEPDPSTHKQFYQNCNAFPHIAPLTSHYSSTDLASLLNNKAYQGKFDSTEALMGGAKGMTKGLSQLSLSSDSSSDSSDDSSEDGVPYIMPLSHSATLTATGDDGRIRLIVPVSPSESASDVPEAQPEPSTSKATKDNTLRVPEQSVAASSSITRTTSEKTTPALSRPESGFVSGMEEGADAATLAEAKNMLLQLGVKKKKRILPLRFKRRILANKHTML